MPGLESVVVIGGGFAGLACAVSLARRGVRVTLLEARRQLGGRAGSFTHEATGEAVDNGQHLLLSGYRHTLAFLTSIGTDRHVRFQRNLTVEYVEPGRRTRLACPPLPAPWHLIAGVLALKGLTLADRTALLAAVPELIRLRRASMAENLKGLSVTAWLDRMGQTPGLRRRLWHPLAIATLNESPEAAPASLLAAVLRDGFLSDRRGSCLGLATVGLGDLYTEASRQIIESRGGQVRVGVAAAALEVAGDRVGGVRTRTGELIRADAYVSSVPPSSLSRLGVTLPGLDRFASSPILSVNLWLDRPISQVADFDFAGVLGGRIQWLFNKERILDGRASHLAAVISAARDHVDKSNEDLAAMAWEDVVSCLPAARSARVVRSMVVRERTATFSATVETEPLRPGELSPYANMLLAGDWTMRGMPATIEAAVMSGHRCAERITSIERSYRCGPAT